MLTACGNADSYNTVLHIRPSCRHRHCLRRRFLQRVRERACPDQRPWLKSWTTWPLLFGTRRVTNGAVMRMLLPYQPMTIDYMSVCVVGCTFEHLSITCSYFFSSCTAMPTDTLHQRLTYLDDRSLLLLVLRHV